MKKMKYTKSHLGISPEGPEKLKYTTPMISTGSSLHLSGYKFSNDYEQTMKLNKPSEVKVRNYDNLLRMRYKDKVYGNFNITEPVILELLTSPALKRLKDIDQAGYGPLLAKPYKRVGQFGHNRLTHSIGVYLLLKKYNAPLQEQIAGLIHDVSHSAFSHCIDYVLDEGDGRKQNHQDNMHNDFVKKTEIYKILNKYGFDLKYILDDENFPLKEKNLPDLCADRIDYILREGLIFKEITYPEVKNMLENLIVKDNRWVFKNIQSAKKFSRLFLKLNQVYYSGFATAIMFRAVGDCLRYALNKKYITRGDLYATDKIIIAEIKKRSKKDKELNILWLRMNGKIKATQNDCDYDSMVFCKSRIVDPLFMENGKIKRLSTAESNWKKIVKQELKPKKYFLKFESSSEQVKI